MSEIGEVPQNIKSEQQVGVRSADYAVDGLNVKVNYRTFFPQEHAVNPDEISSDKLIVVFPGWAMNAGAKSQELVGKAFAEAGQRKVLVIDTKPDKIVDDSLYKEAVAVENLIRESGAKHVIIAGHSEGGIKAVDLAVILQNLGQTSVDGIVLMDSVGLYDQGAGKNLAKRFAKDSLLDTSLLMVKNLRHGDTSTFMRGLRAGTDILFGITEELRRNKLHYPERLSSQIREMIKKQTHLGEVKAPVILIQGVKDDVSDPNRVVPEYQDLKHMVKAPETGEYFDPREQFLQENLFLQSPYVRMVTGKKTAEHAMPFFRAEQIAKTSLGLIERSKR